MSWLGSIILFLIVKAKNNSIPTQVYYGGVEWPTYNGITFC